MYFKSCKKVTGFEKIVTGYQLLVSGLYEELKADFHEQKD